MRFWGMQPLCFNHRTFQLPSQMCFSCMDSTEATLILSLKYSHFCQETRHTWPSSQLLSTNQNSTSHTTHAISLRTEVASRQRALLSLISPVKVGHRAHQSANNKTAFLRCPKHKGWCLFITTAGKINGLSESPVCVRFCWLESEEILWQVY